MSMEERGAYTIILEEFCRSYDIEKDFVLRCIEGRIISARFSSGTWWLEESELTPLERLVRLHQDLGINAEGVETIHHLLLRIESLQQEVRRLRNKLSLYEE